MSWNNSSDVLGPSYRIWWGTGRLGYSLQGIESSFKGLHELLC